MPKHQLSLAMSQIIACDAPLLSPTDSNASWEPLFSPSHDSFTYAYYNIPPSPQPTHPTLKMRCTPDSTNDLCLPTHQLFDFPPEARSSRSPSPPPTHNQGPSTTPSASARSRTPRDRDDDDDDLSCGNKRSASPAPSATKKRAIGERISSKDFVPPDVSGLSKREARLVKNRAAAFLSRQRKREEFECMEVRVAELEQENARLLALTQSGPSSSASAPSASLSSTPQQQQQQQQPSNPQLLSEVEQLKAQLAAARERELSLSAQLASASLNPPVKQEATEHNLYALSSASPSRSTPTSSSSLSSAHKSGASLGLMVLLCALPTLLSMRMQSPTAPTSFAIPNPFPSSEYNSNFLPSEYDWAKTTGSSSSGSSLMDLDADPHHHHYSSQLHHRHTRKQLEFTGTESSAELGGLGLGDLDISFDTTSTDDGKIRVRIHPSSLSSSTSSASSSSSRSGSPGLSSSSSQTSSSESADEPRSPVSPTSAESSLAMWSGSNKAKDAESSLQASFASQFSALSAYSSSSSSSSLPPPVSSISTPTDPFLGVPTSANDYMMMMMPFSADGSMRYGSRFEHGFGSSSHLGAYGANMGVGMDMDGIESYPMGAGFDMGMGEFYGSASAPSDQMPFGLGEKKRSDSGKGEKRRVRIALKSMPAVGGEGGEWEVQIC